MKRDHEFEKVVSTPDLFCELTDLQPDTIYYVRVNAVNELGVGYDAQSTFFMTPDYSSSKAYSLYVWGENSNAQLGLSDEQITETKENYRKYKMLKVVKNESFESQVVQVSPGNVSTTVLYYDPEISKATILQSGLTSLPKDEESDQKKFYKSEGDKVENIAALPFEIPFYIPVAKVQCGDMFASLLTVEGDVYSWGYNLHG